MLYFIYKPLFEHHYGLIYPNTSSIKHNNNVHLELATKRGYRLGSCESPLDVKDMLDFIITFIDEDLAKGFKLLDINYKISNEPIAKQNENDTQNYTQTFTNLTPEELELQRKANDFCNQIVFEKVSLSKYGGLLSNVINHFEQEIDRLKSRLFVLEYSKPAGKTEKSKKTKKITTD